MLIVCCLIIMLTFELQGIHKAFKCIKVPLYFTHLSTQFLFTSHIFAHISCISHMFFSHAVSSYISPTCLHTFLVYLTRFTHVLVYLPFVVDSFSDHTRAGVHRTADYDPEREKADSVTGDIHVICCLLLHSCMCF